MASVGFEVGAVDQDVIDVYNDAFVQEWTEHIVDQSLECRGGVGEAEGHYREFVMAISRAEGCLRDILVLDADLVIAGAEVDLGEHLGTLYSVEYFINTREGVTVLDGQFVQRAVVDTHSQASVLLFDK